ncbi:putative mitochondrial inner membrane protease subunit 1 [Aspergillus undulatus]|uniref:putative mitochondrial inner membrane protease subunit 1 n=1 Tax=Aspergillus undulatus TaxID=1810928 RepID=UPI003CCD11E3
MAPPADRLIRYLLRTTHPGAIFRKVYYGLGAAAAGGLFWENVLMIQLSEGPSMYPTFSPRGDYLLISKLHKHGRGIEVGDVVRFWHPSFVGVYGAKRVLGMPGDFVCRDQALGTEAGRTGEMIRVPEGHVYVGGDNLPWSRDSRNYGPLPMGLINGKVVARVWPPSRMQWVENPLKPVEDVKGLE